MYIHLQRDNCALFIIIILIVSHQNRVAQVKQADEQLADELYEMSKPLARYADDEDLERMLKAREREGDPMLAYLRKKQTKVDAPQGRAKKRECVIYLSY